MFKKNSFLQPSTVNKTMQNCFTVHNLDIQWQTQTRSVPFPPGDFFICELCAINKSTIQLYYWRFNNDAAGQTGLFSSEPFRVLLSDIIFLSVFTSHSASNSRVSEVSKVVLPFFMMSEALWTAGGGIFHSFLVSFYSLLVALLLVTR